MIFYFSGTGNSQYIAEQLKNTDEVLISISEALKKGSVSYEVLEGESVGFVFPVYFYTVPTIIREFVDKLQLNGASYVYAAITCGGGIGQAGAVLKKALEKRGITLSMVNEVLMPDNSMLFYQIPGVEGAMERIQKADALCEEIKRLVEAKEVRGIGNHTAISALMGLGYKACNKTKKFYATEQCVSCGLCERNCPEDVIQIENGRPKWIKESCCKCSACINRCPVSAIQYGTGTIKRNRYVNPMI